MILAVVGPKLPEALTSEPFSSAIESPFTLRAVMLAFLTKTAGYCERLRRLSMLLFFKRVPGI